MIPSFLLELINYILLATRKNTPPVPSKNIGFLSKAFAQNGGITFWFGAK